MPNKKTLETIREALEHDTRMRAHQVERVNSRALELAEAITEAANSDYDAETLARILRAYVRDAHRDMDWAAAEAERLATEAAALEYTLELVTAEDVELMDSVGGAE